MTIIEIVTLIGGIIAMLGVAVSITARLLTASYKATEEQLKQDRHQLKNTLEALESRNEELSRMLLAIKEVGSSALMKMDSVNMTLKTIKSLLAVGACSVAIPNPLSTAPELIFLSLESPKAGSVKRQRIPLTSIGGEVYSKGKPILRNAAPQDNHWHNGVDKASGFNTESVLCIPLFHNAKVVGVLYLLNKINNQPFLETDIDNIGRISSDLAALVADFTADPRNFDVLGVTPDRPPSEGTVIFCDLSNSRDLLRSVRPSEAIDRINEYLSTLIQVGFDFGAVAEMSVGGSFMLKLNISPGNNKHTLIAIAAGLRMTEAFMDLKERWLKTQLPVDQLYCRIGIESGPLHGALLGHPHNLQNAVLGEPVEIARSLCDFADINNNVVIIGEGAFSATFNMVDVKAVKQSSLGPARRLISRAYEVLSIHEEALEELKFHRNSLGFWV